MMEICEDVGSAGVKYVDEVPNLSPEMNMAVSHRLLRIIDFPVSSNWALCYKPL